MYRSRSVPRLRRSYLDSTKLEFYNGGFIEKYEAAKAESVSWWCAAQWTLGDTVQVPTDLRSRFGLPFRSHRFGRCRQRRLPRVRMEISCSRASQGCI